MDGAQYPATHSGRLSTLAAAMVIARRDFVAILWSRSFIFFLLGPLFPVLVGGLAGGIGSKLDATANHTVIGVVMPAPDADAMMAANVSANPAPGGVTPGPTLALAQAATTSATPAQVSAYATGASNTTMAPSSLSLVGGNQSHENRQPFLTLNFCISLQGIFPTQS